jgi:hypothetical protein
MSGFLSMLMRRGDADPRGGRDGAVARIDHDSELP